MRDLDCLFTPRSIALIGASPDAGHLGGVVFSNLRAFRGRLYPVNPRHREIGGIVAFPSIRDLPEPVDLSVILRPAAEIPHLLAEHAGRARCAVIVSAGFAETGADALQREVEQLGRELGIRLMGPNCLGVFNPYRRLDTFFLPHDRFRRPRRGNVAVVSQSGALLVCLLEALARAGRGVSRGINYGNAVDIDAPDLFDYLADDPETGVVIAYLESVGDGRRFMAAAAALERRKPLIILKAGKGAGGARAAFSHTGRLAGNYEVFSSILGQFGIREAGTFEELLDATHALSRQRPAPGRRVCIVTNAGGLGVLAADECSRQGLVLSPLPADVQLRLRENLPPFYSVGNPLDLTGQVTDGEYLTALHEIQDSCDGIFVIAHTGVAGITPRLAALLADFRSLSGKPLVVLLGQGGTGAKLARLLERDGIPCYPSPERGVRGLRALLGTGGEP
ncbi:MAG: CoA-binding protein [Desulfuromonadales bacterium]|nr:MAG: CoA-binding protein [Desulfuromonadales bacterium]